MRWLLALACVALAWGCMPQVTGAACRTDDNCPDSQRCAWTCLCEEGDRGLPRSCSGLVLRSTLTSSGGGRFGAALGLSASGDRLFVGDPDARVSSGSGTIEVDERTASTPPAWSRAQEFSSASLGDGFGGLIAVSASGAKVLSGDSAGSNVYGVEKNGGTSYLSAFGGPASALAMAEGDDRNPRCVGYIANEFRLRLASYSNDPVVLPVSCTSATATVGLAVSPKGDFIAASCNRDGAILRLQFDGGTQGPWLPAARHPFLGRVADLSKDGRTLATILADGGVALYALGAWPADQASLGPSVILTPEGPAASVRLDSTGSLALVSQAGVADPVALYQRAAAGFVRLGGFRAPAAASDPSFGQALALSSDGGVVVVGAPGTNHVYVFSP